MSEEDFTKIYHYMQKEFTSVHKEIAEVKSNVNTYANAIDAYAKQAETYMQEMLALAHKVDRLEQWIMKVAEATGVKLVA